MSEYIIDRDTTRRMPGRFWFPLMVDKPLPKCPFPFRVLQSTEFYNNRDIPGPWDDNESNIRHQLVTHHSVYFVRLSSS